MSHLNIQLLWQTWCQEVYSNRHEADNKLVTHFATSPDSYVTISQILWKLNITVDTSIVNILKKLYDNSGTNAEIRVIHSKIKEIFDYYRKCICSTAHEYIKTQSHINPHFETQFFEGVNLSNALTNNLYMNYVDLPHDRSFITIQEIHDELCAITENGRENYKQAYKQEKRKHEDDNNNNNNNNINITGTEWTLTSPGSIEFKSAFDDITSTINKNVPLIEASKELLKEIGSITNEEIMIWKTMLKHISVYKNDINYIQELPRITNQSTKTLNAIEINLQTIAQSLISQDKTAAIKLLNDTLADIITANHTLTNEKHQKINDLQQKYKRHLNQMQKKSWIELNSEFERMMQLAMKQMKQLRVQLLTKPSLTTINQLEPSSQARSNKLSSNQQQNNDDDDDFELAYAECMKMVQEYDTNEQVFAFLKLLQTTIKSSCKGFFQADPWRNNINTAIENKINNLKADVGRDFCALFCEVNDSLEQLRNKFKSEADTLVKTMYKLVDEQYTIIEATIKSLQDHIYHLKHNGSVYWILTEDEMQSKHSTVCNHKVPYKLLIRFKDLFELNSFAVNKFIDPNLQEQQQQQPNKRIRIEEEKQDTTTTRSQQISREKDELLLVKLLDTVNTNARDNVTFITIMDFVQRFHLYTLKAKA